MSKAARTRQQSARARIAAERAAARRAQVRNRVLLTGGSILVVIAIVVTFVVVKAGRSTPGAAAGSPAGTAGTVLPASVSGQVTSVPASTLNAVGGGSVTSYNPAPVKAVSGAPLTRGGKPEMLYIGAEFCPLLRGVAVVYGGGPEQVRRVHHAAARDPLLQHRRGPQHRVADVLQGWLHQQAPGLHPGGEREGQPRSALQATTPQQQAIWDKYDANSYPVHRLRQQAHRHGSAVRPAGPAGQDLGADRCGAARPRPAPSRRAPSAPRTT